MDRPTFLLLAATLLLVPPAGAFAGDASGAGEKAFEGAKITLDLANVKACDVLKEIERQTGCEIRRGRTVADPVLPGFKASGEAFWPVFDRLCKVSGNVFEPESKGG
jgi:hypothetical protein